MVKAEWNMKRIRDLNLEDAITAYTEGFSIICGDGKIKYVTNMDQYN